MSEMYNGKQLNPLTAEYQSLFESGIEERRRYNEMLRNVEKPYKDHYLTLEEAYSGLTEQDLCSLMNDDTFVNLNKRLNALVESEMLKVIRVNLNKNEEAQKTIENMVNIVNDYKKRKNDENERIMDEMKDYMTHYSDMTFNEYKNMKGK